MSEEQNRFSLRKLSVGLASVLIGVSIFGTSQTVKADTVANNQTSSMTNNAQSSDTQENKNAVKSSFSSDNQANNVKSNLIQTQVEGKKDQKQDSVPKTQEATDGNNLDAEKDIVRTSSLQEPDNQSNNHAEDNSQTQLNITKNSQQLDQKELATNLTQDNSTQNNDWADPAKQGYVRTSVGWTKNYKNYKNIAKRSYTTLMEDAASHTPITSTNNYLAIGHNAVSAIETHAVIDKNNIIAGNNILVSSIPILKNNDKNSAFVSFETGLASHEVRYGNKLIGSFSIHTTNNEADTFFHVSNDFTDKLAKDLSITLYDNYVFNMDTSDNYPSLRGVSDSNPLQYEIITNNSNGTDTRFIYNIKKSNVKFLQNNSLADNSNITHDGQILGWSPSIPYSSIVMWVGHDSNIKTPYHPWHYNKVIKIQRMPDSTGYTNKIHVSDGVHINIWDSAQLLGTNNQVYENLGRTPNFMLNAQALGEGLSSQQVQAEAQNKHFVYSLSKDHSSILIGLNITDDVKSLSKIASFAPTKNDLINYLTQAVKRSYVYNIGDPDHGSDYLTNTLNGYKANDYNFLNSQAEISGIYSDKSKNIIETINDVTPNAQYKFNALHGSLDAIGTSVDMSAYRTLNIDFVDDDNNGKLINSDVFTTSTGTDLTYNIKSANDPTFNSQTDIGLPTNVLLADNQPTSVHYGMIKDTNPDIVIHVKHKIVKGVSGDDKMLDNYPNIKKALNASIRLVVNHNYPDNGKFTDENEYPRQYVESIALKRTADVDLTTDSVISGTVGKWTEVSSNNHITFENGLLSPAPANIFVSPSKGYTAYNADTSEKMPSVFTIIDSNKINDLDVLKDGGMFSKSINIVYKADSQKIQVKFVDDDDPNKAQVGDIITVNGVTDGQADFKDVISAYNQDQAKYYVLAKDQTDPNTLKHTFIANDSTVFTVHLKHQHAKSTDQAPATRTIVVHMPDGSTKTYVQTIGFVNNFDKDLVTNKTTNIYTVDSSKSNVTVDGQVSTQYQAYVLKDGVVNYAPIKLPHINGYKVKLIQDKANPAMFMVSFVAVPTETKPSNPVEVAPSKPSANADNTNKPADDLKDLKQRVVTELNSNDSGWTMPNTQPATYTVEVPDDNTIDLFNLVIAEPVHAQTTTQIHVTKRFKLSKKHSIKHLKHRKKAVRTFRKYRL